MKRNVLVLILNLCIMVSNAKVNLKCGPSRYQDNCICDITIDPVTNLPIHEATCHYLHIDEFPAFDSVDLINSVDISHNNLKRLRQTENISQFGNMVFTLKFCHNLISEIDDNFFYPFPNLKTVDLSNNFLSTLTINVFEKLANLEVLDLSFNQIKMVEDGIFNSLKNLKNLNLSYNPLSNVLQNPTALVDKLGLNANLLYLSLDNVGVTRIHTKCWNSFTQLKYLSVADNPIVEIPQTSSTLEYLDISGTIITNLHENYLKYSNLKVLKMARMEYLTSIAPYALYNLGSLEELVLTDSPQLQDFNELSFGLLDRKSFPRQLRRFSLARNRLKTLNQTYEYIFQEMEDIDVSFNSWNCNCDLLWMKKVDSLIRRKIDMRCASPNEMVNKLVLELQPKDVPNCYPEIYGKKSHQTALLVLTMVVFALIVVITYLCLYSPSWSIKISRTKVSPDSPYSINNEQI